MKRHKRKTRRAKSTSHLRGTKASSKSSRVHRPIVKPKAKRTPSRKAKRSRKPKISHAFPKSGMSKTFGQFVEPVGKKNGGIVYAIVVLDFVYGRKHNRFSIPLALGSKSKAKVNKLTFADIEDELRISAATIQRAELVEVKGFVQLKARKYRRGKKIHARGKRAKK